MHREKAALGMLWSTTHLAPLNPSVNELTTLYNANVLCTVYNRVGRQRTYNYHGLWSIEWSAMVHCSALYRLAATDLLLYITLDRFGSAYIGLAASAASSRRRTRQWTGAAPAPPLRCLSWCQRINNIGGRSVWALPQGLEEPDRQTFKRHY